MVFQDGGTGSTVNATVANSYADTVAITFVGSSSDVFNINAPSGSTVSLANYTKLGTGTLALSSVGSGGNTLTGSATAATSITGGAGVDNITGGAGADTITGAGGADSISPGAGSDTVYFGTNSGSDTVYLATTALNTGTVGDGATDHVQWNFVTATALAIATAAVKTIYGFEAGTGTDVIEFKYGLLNSATAATSSIATAAYTAQELATNANFIGSVAAAASNAFIEITGTGNLNATGVAGGATSVAALITGTVDTFMKVIFSVDDGTDSYLWFFNGVTGATATQVEASELTLIGIVKGVNDFGAGDFAVVA